MVSRRTFVKGAAAAPLLGSAIVAVPRIGAQDEPIGVGSKNFTEQYILGQMYLQLLENAGFSVEDATNLGGTLVAHEALVNGEIALYPEYTGTGLTVVLDIPFEEFTAMGAATPGATPAASATPGATDLRDAVYQFVSQRYAEQFDLVWLEPTPFNNTQALAVQRAFSEENGVTTISQLAEIAGDLTISAPSDFIDRADGLQGLQQVYNAGFADIEPLIVEPGLKYQALLDDQAQVVLAFGTDGQIAGYDLVLLEDDLGLWPPYPAAPVVRQETLDANPEIADILNAVAPLLTDEVMSDLNWQVDGDERREPAEVATDFLTENGLLDG